MGGVPPLSPWARGIESAHFAGIRTFESQSWRCRLIRNGFGAVGDEALTGRRGLHDANAAKRLVRATQLG